MKKSPCRITCRRRRRIKRAKDSPDARVHVRFLVTRGASVESTNIRIDMNETDETAERKKCRINNANCITVIEESPKEKFQNFMTCHFSLVRVRLIVRKE